jgi:hypothetical protein
MDNANCLSSMALLFIDTLNGVIGEYSGGVDEIAS